MPGPGTCPAIPGARPWAILIGPGLARLLAGLLAVGVAAGAAAGLSEAERAARAAELERLRARIATLRREFEQVRTRHDAERRKLREVEHRAGRLVRNLRRLERELRAGEKRLAGLQRRRRALRRELAVQRRLLGEQVYAAFVIGRQEYLKLVLNQEDPGAAGRVFVYYRYFNQARARRIEEARATLARLDEVEARIRTRVAELERLRRARQRDRAALEVTLRERQAVVDRLRRELAGREEELNRLGADQRRLERLLSAIREVLADIPPEAGRAQPFARLRGRLRWPARGRVEKLYGRKRAGGRVRWNGVLIRAPEGRDVRAVARGRVAFADWLRGYGLLIIIDHGDGYMSLYGHNQALYKETGDWVEAGEVIAAVGRSGGRERAALYFEIRHRGRPSNPVQWCRNS